MTERAWTNQAFVSAINAIPLEFAEQTGKIGEVRTAWRIYLHHLSKDANDPTWAPARVDLLALLLLKMGSALGYVFDRVDIEQGIYAPTGHVKLASDTDTIREGVAALFRGEKALPLDVKSMATNPEIVELWRDVLTKLSGWLERNPGVAPPLQSIDSKGTPRQ